MRTIERATAFKRDYKREAKGQHRATLDNELNPYSWRWRQISRLRPNTATMT